MLPIISNRNLGIRVEKKDTKYSFFLKTKLELRWGKKKQKTKFQLIFDVAKNWSTMKVQAENNTQELPFCSQLGLSLKTQEMDTVR